MKVLNEDWEFGVLGVYNFRQAGPLEEFYKFLEENLAAVEGDICEVGVFRGRSLLATALFLKEIRSSKKVYGFDSFAGFPNYHANDELARFDELHQQGRITDEHYTKVKLNERYRTRTLGELVGASNISTSGDFSSCSYESLIQMIDFLKLDNIVLVKGSFDQTMGQDILPDVKFCAGLVDCDLYSSYHVSLPFLWERLSKGGYLFLDEYYSLKFPGARIASDEFFKDKSNRPQKHKQKPGDFERWFVRKVFV